MARAALTEQTITHAGTALTYTAPTGAGANNGWTWANTGAEILEIKNTDTVTHTLTLKASASLAGIALQDQTVTVPAAAAGAPGYVKVKLATVAFGATGNADIDVVTGITAALISA